MAKYVAKHKGQLVSSVFLHDQEYKAREGLIYDSRRARGGA